MARPNVARSIGSEANVAQRIQSERERRGWTYDALARQMTAAGCSINGSAIYKIEKGRPRRRITVDELVTFAKVFGTDIQDLLTPIELLRKDRVQELIKRTEEEDQNLAAAMAGLLTAYHEYFELAAYDPELSEYVHNQKFNQQLADESAAVPLFTLDVGDGRTREIPAEVDQRLREAMGAFYVAIIEAAGSVEMLQLEQEITGGDTP